MAKIYESEADKKREDSVAEAIAKKWRCQQIKCADLHFIDRNLFRDGKMIARAEIKCRNNNHDHYPEYMVDAEKLDNGLKEARGDGLPFLLVVSFVDGIYWIHVTNEVTGTRRQGGRIDRDDPNDIEICCYIPHEWFHKL